MYDSPAFKSDQIFSLYKNSFFSFSDLYQIFRVYLALPNTNMDTNTLLYKDITVREGVRYRKVEKSKFEKKNFIFGLSENGFLDVLEGDSFTFVRQI